MQENINQIKDAIAVELKSSPVPKFGQIVQYNLGDGRRSVAIIINIRHDGHDYTVDLAILPCSDVAIYTRRDVCYGKNPHRWSELE